MTLEKFRPRLKPGQFFATPMGLVFELEDGSKQVTLPSEAQTFTALIDGKRSVQEIIEATFRKDHRVPFKALISALQKLRQAGCLENPEEAGADSEFETRSEIFDKTETWWERPLFSIPLVKRWNAMEPSTGAFVVFAGGTLLLTLAFLALYLTHTADRQLVSSSFLKIQGSYLLGLVFFVVAASVLASAKTIYKALAALILTGRISHVRMELNLYSLALRMHDDRLYFNADRRLAFLSVASVGLSQFFFFAVAKAVMPGWPLIEDLFVISVILALVDTNPYRKSELTSFFNVIYNQSSISHLLPYLKRRALTAAVGKGEKVADETIYSVYSTLAIAWTVVAFNVALYVLNRNYANLLATVMEGAPQEAAAAAIVTAGIAVTTAYLVFDLVRTIAMNLVFPMLTKRIEKAGRKKTRVVETTASDEKIDVVARLPLFQHATRDAIRFLLEQSQTRVYRDGAAIVVQGTESNELFALVTGEAKVRKRHPTGGETVVATLRAPVLFGENTLLNSAPRSADVVAQGECEAIAIPHKALEELERRGDLAQDHAAIIERLRAGHAISSSELFRGAPSEAVSLFLDEGEIVRVPTGTTIIRQHELDKDFYLLVRGSVDVDVDGNQVQTLGQGDFFGEMALLFDSPRTATVTTREQTSVLKLTSEQFWKVISRHLSLALFLETVSEMRLKQDEISKSQIDPKTGEVRRA